MSEIILHIGTHKTASTSIQDTLAANRAALAAHGVVYPAIGRASGHHTLATHWIDLPQHYYDAAPAAAHWQALAAAHAGSDATVLISSEEFSRGRQQAVDFAELGRMTAGFGRRRVVCVLRNQVDFIQSTYVEIAKKQPTIPFDLYFDRTIANRYAAGLHVDFAMLHDRLRAGFAAEEIVYLSYASLARDPRGLVPAFLAALGLAVPAAALDLPAGGSNVSPNALALWTAARVAEPGFQSPRLVELAEAAFAEHFETTDKRGGRAVLYTPEQVARVEATFGPANAAFLERIGRADLALPFPAFPETTIWRSDLDAGYWMRVARRLGTALLAAERGRPPTPAAAPDAAPAPAPDASSSPQLAASR